MTFLAAILENKKTAEGGLAKYIKDFVCDVQHDGRTVNHTPDAVFALAKNGSPALFFLENKQWLK